MAPKDESTYHQVTFKGFPVPLGFWPSGLPWGHLFPDVIEDHCQSSSSSCQLAFDNWLNDVHVFLIDRFVQIKHSLQYIVVVGANIDCSGIFGINLVWQSTVSLSHCVFMTLKSPRSHINSLGLPHCNVAFEITHQLVHVLDYIVVMSVASDVAKLLGYVCIPNSVQVGSSLASTARDRRISSEELHWHTITAPVVVRGNVQRLV